MLREISIARKMEGFYQRRWYEDENSDLFVWVDPHGKVARFQLAYDKPHAERVVEWRRRLGFSHMRVDDGAHAGHHPGSPLLSPGGVFSRSRVVKNFRERAADLDPPIRLFVLQKLSEFPRPRWDYVLPAAAFIAGLLLARRLLP